MEAAIGRASFTTHGKLSDASSDWERHRLFRVDLNPREIFILKDNKGFAVDNKMVTSKAMQDTLFTHNPHMFRECLTPVQHLSRYLSNDFSRDQHLVNIYMSWGSTARPRGGKESVGLRCSYTAAGGLSSSPQPALHKQLGHEEGCVFIAAVTWAPEKARTSRQSAKPTCAGAFQVSWASKTKWEPLLVSHKGLSKESPSEKDPSSSRWWLSTFLSCTAEDAHPRVACCLSESWAISEMPCFHMASRNPQDISISLPSFLVWYKAEVSEAIYYCLKKYFYRKKNKEKHH